MDVQAFLDLTGVCHRNPTAYGHRISKAVIKATGIPVCVGMAPTKTLAKLANYAAKKWKHTEGVLDLSDPARREKLMKLVPVGEVWGIGSKTSAKLNKMGIITVWDLACQSSQRIHTQFNVVVARTVMELNGIACIELEDITPNKQQIVCSRSFSRRLTTYDELSQALSEFCCRAAEKLRRQHSVTDCISIFIRTDDSLPKENRLLMDTLDHINRRFPKKLSIAATGTDKSWQPKTERISQRYTTDWKELVWVK